MDTAVDRIPQVTELDAAVQEVARLRAELAYARGTLNRVIGAVQFYYYSPHRDLHTTSEVVTGLAASIERRMPGTFTPPVPR